MTAATAIEIPEHARIVLQRLEDHGHEAYVVGGCVRDSLMGGSPADWDVCTSATPQQVLEVFRRFRVIKTGLKHGTVTVRANHENVEVTTFRLDGAYTDNRHPDKVTFVSNVAEDLARRDFTINAMAYSPMRGLVDVFGGREDLAAGLVRCVGEPDARFQEDGLRLLRALRFASRFGFALERETAYAIRRNRHLLEGISAERLFKELKGILCGAGVLDVLVGFPEVFGAFMPELTPMVGLEQHNPYHVYDVWTHTAHAVAAVRPDPALRLAMLFHDSGKPSCFTRDPETGRGHFYGHPAASAELADTILGRLKSDNATRETVVTLVRHHDIDLPTTRPGMRRLVGKMGEDRMPLLFEVKAADAAAQSAFRREERRVLLSQARLLLEDVEEESHAFRVTDLALNGGHLLAMGMKPGAAMGQLLAALLSEVQDEKIPNTFDALRARAAELLAQSQNSVK